MSHGQTSLWGKTFNVLCLGIVFLIPSCLIVGWQRSCRFCQRSCRDWHKSCREWSTSHIAKYDLDVFSQFIIFGNIPYRILLIALFRELQIVISGLGDFCVTLAFARFQLSGLLIEVIKGTFENLATCWFSNRFCNDYQLHCIQMTVLVAVLRIFIESLNST